MTITRNYDQINLILAAPVLAFWLLASSCDNSNDYGDHARTADRAEEVLR